MQRRKFLQSLVAPAIIPASALGLNGATAPSNRVTVATIGTGWMGGSHLDAFLNITDAQ